MNTLTATATVRAALPAYLGTDDDCRRIARYCDGHGIPVRGAVRVVRSIAEPIHRERVELLEDLLLMFGATKSDNWWCVWGDSRARAAGARLVELGLYEQASADLFRKVAQ